MQPQRGQYQNNFHVLQQKANVAVCSKDTDVIILMVFVYALNEISEK